MPQLWLTSAAGGPGLGRVSRPWGSPMFPLPPRVSPHIPLSIPPHPLGTLPLPWRCCHGTVAREPLPGNRLHQPPGPAAAGPHHTDPTQVMAGRMGLWGSVGPPPATTSAPGPGRQGLGVLGWSLLSPPRWIRAPRAGCKQAERLQRGASSLFCCLSLGQEDSWRVTWECGVCSE